MNIKFEIEPIFKIEFFKIKCIDFKNKKELTEWALNQFKKYGIRQPDTYTAAELKYLNPGVPADFIDQHVAKRNKKSKPKSRIGTVFNIYR